MARQLRCSECRAPLNRYGAKTCSSKCRSARSRRLQRAKKKASQSNSLPDHLKAMSQVVEREVKDTARDLLKEEMRPVVREAITSDVLRAVNDLVALTPDMVRLIKEDMQGDDATIRQRAYTLLAKYTLGNPSVAPASAEVQPPSMNVVFQLPRPGDTATPLPPTEVTEVRECAECGASWPVDQFPDDAERCQQCHDKLRNSVMERFAK